MNTGAVRNTSPSVQDDEENRQCFSGTSRSRTPPWRDRASVHPPQRKDCRGAKPLLFERLRYDRPVEAPAGRSGALAFVSTFSQGASRLVWNVLIGRFGGPGLLGVTQSAMATASLGSLFLPASAGSAASKYVAYFRGKGETQTARAVASFIATRALLATAIISCGALGALVLLQHAELDVAFVSLALIIGVSGQVFVRGLHYGAGQVRRQAAWDVISGVVSTMLVLGLLVFGVRSVWILMPVAIANLLFTVVSWPRGSSHGLGRQIRREIDGFLLLGVVGTVASSGFLQSAVLAARATNGTNYAGEFAAALSLVTPISLIAVTISLVLFPAMAAEHGSGVPFAVRDRTSVSTQYLITIMVGLFLAIGILSGPLTALVWGPKFKEADEILLFLLLAVVLNAISMPSVSALTSRSNRGMAISAGSSVVGLVSGVITWIVLGAILPSHFIPIGYLIGAAVTAAIPYGIVWRADRHRWARQTALIFSSLVVAVALITSLNVLASPLWIRLIAMTAALAIWLLVRRKSARALARFSRSILHRSNEGGTVESEPI